MSNAKKGLPIVVLLLIAVLAASGSFFIVKEGKQAILTQFGKPVGGPYQKAGLYFKIPMVQEVHTFEKRLLKWDGSPNQIPTRDKKYIWVDTTARWAHHRPAALLADRGHRTRGAQPPGRHHRLGGARPGELQPVGGAGALQRLEAGLPHPNLGL